MRVHVVGAGLAGLAAALRLAAAGHAVTLYEAGRHAGGRCRSYFDQSLGCRIDNGNHLLIAGNTDAMAYLDASGALETLTGPRETLYPFVDLATGERWVLRPNRGRVPWWILRRGRRIPGTGLRDYFEARALMRAGADETVAATLDAESLIFRRLWAPLAIAALNTETAAGSALLLRRVLAESFAQGGAACRPLVPREGLSESLVDPALRKLVESGAEVRFGARLRALVRSSERVEALEFEGERVGLDTEDVVVLAVTAPVAQRLLPESSAPDEFRAILKAHYRVRAPAESPLMIGVLGGIAEWVFRKAEVLSVTVSAADPLIDRPAEELAPLLWRDVARSYGMRLEPMPPWQVVKERRATFAATPAQDRRRPGTSTGWRNLLLAGDWTATGLPATIEGAIRSGHRAAAAITKDLSAGRPAAMVAPATEP